MKLTEERLKQMIAEELASLNELDPFGGGDRGEDMPPTDAEKAATAPPEDKATEKAKVDSISKLRAELIDLSKNITSVKGLDPTEVNLISGLIGVVLNLSSSGSASMILQRVYNVLQKQAGK